MRDDWAGAREGRVGVLDRVAGGAVLGLARGLGALPPAVGDAMGAALGTVAYAVDARHRSRAVENLLGAGVAEDAGAARHIARQVFQNLGRGFADVCRLPRLTDATIAGRLRLRGYERIRAARALGHGVILVTAHLGAWELLPLASALQGDPIHVVVRPMDNATLDRAITAIRRRGGNGIIRKQELMRAGLKVLKAGGTLGILIDQNITWREGVFVEFFGRPASTAYAPALLALRTGAAVLPVAIFREGPGRHRVEVEEPIPLSRTGDLRQDLLENTARFTRAIEAFVRQSPAEWFWVHRRWKTQPRPGSGSQRNDDVGETSSLPDGDAAKTAMTPEGNVAVAPPPGGGHA